MAKVLVYGAGPLGSLFAAKLKESGHEVSILARNQRLSDIREHGIVLFDEMTKQQTVTHVAAVESLMPDDLYDLIMVIMRKNKALEILPNLAANRQSPNILFLMNNAAGPDALVAALGSDRVLTGFPGSAGFRDGYVVHCLTGHAKDKAKVFFGEIDGQIRDRTRSVAQIIDSVPEFRAEIRRDMDIWLKYHVALLFPSIAPALFCAGVDIKRLARTRDLIVLAVRAIREGFAVLKSQGLPVTPSKFKILLWLPEPILVYFLQRLLNNPLMEIALAKHARAAHDESQHLIGEFMALAQTTPVPTTTINQLLKFYDPESESIADGSKTIPLHWGGLLSWIIGIVTLIGIIISLAL